MRADEVAALHAAVARLRAAGRTPTEIARELGCSRTTVYRALSAEVPDARVDNPGRPAAIPDRVARAVLEARAGRPSCGAAMLHGLMGRHPERYGLSPDEVPSERTIGRLLHAAGLSRKPVGPRDKRVYPDARERDPGHVSLDLWGPWSVRALRLYLATVQDRASRLAGAVPASGVRLPGEPGETPGLTADTWCRALAVADRFLCPGGIRRVSMDNGIGLAPSSYGLPRSVRYALSLGASVVFVPPAQPWRNGVLERFHWSMEREYWREEQPASEAAALRGLTDWLNFHNQDRPHRGLDGRAPADLHPCPPLPDRYWELVKLPEPGGPQEGSVEAVRIVFGDGRVDTWGQQMRLPAVLAGQYVRIHFDVRDGTGTGVVLWQPRKGVDVPVATFGHTLDGVRQRPDRWTLYHDVVHLDLHDDPPPNQGIDMGQLENQMARTLKRSVDLADGARRVEEPVHEPR